MAKNSNSTHTRIKIGGVEVVMHPQPQKGRLSVTSLRSAVSKAVSSEKPNKK